MLSFKPTFSLSSFTFIKRLFSTDHRIGQKEIEEIQIRKEVKLSLFIAGMILYIENIKDATKKLLELVNNFSKASNTKAPLVVQTVKRLPTCGRPRFNPWVGKILWRRKWQPAPLFLPGKSHGQSSLVRYSPWGCKESDMTERLHFPFHFSNTKPIFGNQLHFYTLIMKQLKK